MQARVDIAATPRPGLMGSAYSACVSAYLPSDPGLLYAP
jgi:hypothetical protein